jgi:hypothetical protein
VLDDVLNEDAPVPVRVLADLLQVEDVPLASARLLTLVVPSRGAATPDADGARAPLGQLASRYLLLTLDGTRAANALAARGGGQAGLHQMLRRCVVHAEDLLANAGIEVRRLDEVAVATLFAAWLGPATTPSVRRPAHAVEGWTSVAVNGTSSTAYAVTGTGPDLGDRVQQLAAAAPTPIAATALVVGPGARPDTHVGSWILRLSAPAVPEALVGVHASLSELAKPLDLMLQPGCGEQAALLRATMPIGAGTRS